MAGDMKPAGFDFVVAEHLIEKRGEDAVAALEEQLAVRRRRNNNDIAPAFGLVLEVVFDHAVNDPHFLTTSGKSEYGGIGLGRIVSVGQHDFVFHLDAVEGSGLRNDLGVRRDGA